MQQSFYKYLFVIAGTAFLTTSCYRVRPSDGGGQISQVEQQRIINPADIALPAGYQVEPVATGLTYPTGITFDDQGLPYVVESGYSYGEDFTTPRLLRIEPGGGTTVVAQGENNGPWNGVAFEGGAFYVAEGGVMQGGKILKISKDGAVQALAEGLPSVGDHHTNGPVVKDGWVYFTIGTATNSGVVGEDNDKYGWLKRQPTFHDIPCRDITLRGENFETSNALADGNARVQTGAFVPYGTPTQQGQVIKGQLPCTGALLRVPVQGGPLELVAWGLRNPFGMAWSTNGELYVADNAYDNRGSRPVWGAGDVLWKIQPGMWYGWPDFWEGRSLQDTDMFKTPGKNPPPPLLAQYPNDPPRPVAIMGVHSSATGFDFSRSNNFGFQGQAFVAQFGDMAPVVGKIMSPVGYKIVRVDTNDGVIEDFATNRGRRNGPASWLKSGGFERPIAARFDPAGTALYVVDFGVTRMDNEGAKPKQGTGVIWKITRQ